MKKLLFSLLLLLLSLVIMSTASFAWFTISREVNAVGMDVTVISATNLLISNDPDATFGESATAANYYVYYVQPASSADGTAHFIMSDNTSADFSGKRTAATEYLVGTETLVAGQESRAGAYVDYVFYLRTDGDTPVGVFISDVVLTRTEGGTDEGIRAFRFAILEDEAKTVPAAGNVWANGYSYATSVTAEQSAALAGCYALNASGVIGAPADDLTYNPSPDGDPVTGVRETLKKVHFLPNVLNPSSRTPVFTVPAKGTEGGDVKMVTVRVWIEGEDAACTVQNVAKLDFHLSLRFRDVTDFKES